jgi:hypothetical protein
MFPAGLPGVALFLLRICVIGMLFDATMQSSLSGVSLGRMVALALTSLLLLFGAFTPIAALVSIVLAACCWPTWEPLSSFEFSIRAAVMIALALLGPGAYSMDARMFGRRLILPPK